jgi:hypothetical protein
VPALVAGFFMRGRMGGMSIDRKAEPRRLRDEIAEALINSLAHLKALGFSRQGRCWKRPHEHTDGPVIDIIEFELTVLKSSVRVKMYEMRWVQTGKKTTLGTQIGRQEGTDNAPQWSVDDASALRNILAAVRDRVERVTLPWFAAGGDASNAVEVYPFDESDTPE